jgi:hypothetical protein
METISFADALERTHRDRRHLLLGNGFSIAKDPSFDYPSLYGEAVKADPSFATLFDAATGTNFELAMRTLPEAEAARVREGLVSTISRMHPRSWVSYLSGDDFHLCGQFLEHFVGLRRGSCRGFVFTTNYDLLIYWVLMKNKAALKCYDGFDNYGDWRQTAPSQVFYIHGALHIFEEPAKPGSPAYLTRKLRYADANPIADQILRNLEKQVYPVFVSEGGPQQKKARQKQSDYTKSALRRFERECDQPGDVLFSFGAKFDSPDQHIVDVIAGGKIGRVFIGVYSGEDRCRALAVAHEWTDARKDRRLPPVDVTLFDSKTCRVWAKRAAPRP